MAMSRAAREYARKIGIVTKSLEVTLGPDTSDLSIRIGLNRYANQVFDILLGWSHCFD